jgi:hypothetical protein
MYVVIEDLSQIGSCVEIGLRALHRSMRPPWQDWFMKMNAEALNRELKWLIEGQPSRRPSRIGRKY